MAPPHQYWPITNKFLVQFLGSDVEDVLGGHQVRPLFNPNFVHIGGRVEVKTEVEGGGGGGGGGSSEQYRQGRIVSIDLFNDVVEVRYDKLLGYNTEEEGEGNGELEGGLHFNRLRMHTMDEPT